MSIMWAGIQSPQSSVSTW